MQAETAWTRHVTTGAPGPSIPARRHQARGSLWLRPLPAVLGLAGLEEASPVDLTPRQTPRVRELGSCAAHAAPLRTLCPPNTLM